MLRKSANFDLNVQPIVEESEAEAASGNVSFLIERFRPWWSITRQSERSPCNGDGFED